MKKKVLALLMSTAMVVGLLAGCGAPAAADTDSSKDDTTKKETAEGIPADEIKIGFVHVSDPSDMGYTYNHDLGT